MKRFVWIAGLCWLLCTVEVLYADEYTYYARNDFTIENIDMKDGIFWLAGGWNSATRYDIRTGDYQPLSVSDIYYNDPVRKIYQARDGSVWFAMGKGVLKYDGVSFTKFDSSTGYDIRDTYDIVEDTAGTLWFACGGGVFSLAGTKMTRYDQYSGLANPEYTNVALSPDNILWVTCEREIARFMDGKWTVFTPDRTWTEAIGFRFFDMFFDADGTIWCGTSRGVFTFDGVNWTRYTTQNGLFGDTVTAIAQVPDGAIWAATGMDEYNGYTFSVFDGSSWSVYSDTNHTIAMAIRSSFTTEDGTLWFGAYNNELYRVKDGVLDAVHVETGLNSSWPFDVAADSQNRVWLATDKGIQRIENGVWKTYFRRDGLPGGYVYDVAVGHDGAVWAAADSGAARFDGLSWQPYRSGEGLPEGRITRVAPGENEVWFGTEKGIARLKDDQWRLFTKADGLAEDFIVTVAADGPSVVWAGTTAGLSRYDGSSWRTYTKADGLPSDSVSVVFREPEGNLWVGTSAGLASFDGASWTTYRVGDGVSSLPDNLITAITADRDGRLWFGTAKGSAWFDGTAWGVDYKIDKVSGLAVDNDNVLWRAALVTPLLSHPLSGMSPPSPRLPGTLKVVTRELNAFDMTVTDTSVWSVYMYDIFRFDKASEVVVKYPRETLVAIAHEIDSGPTDDTVFSVNYDRSDGPCYLCSFDGAEWNTCYNSSYWYIKGLTVDERGEAWFRQIASHSEGFIIHYGPARYYKTAAEKPAFEFRADGFFVTEEGIVWAGGQRIAKTKKPYFEAPYDYFQDWDYIDTPQGLGGFNIIEQAADGSMLFGTDYEHLPGYGVARYDGTSWTIYSVDDGLLSNKVRDIAVDKKGAWWVSTDKGISYYDGVRWTGLQASGSPLLQDDYNSIDVDREGVVWIGSPFGLMSFTYDDTVSVKETAAPPVPFSLAPVHPNPFNAQTTVSYTLDRPGDIALDVYNVAGQRIRTLTRGTMRAGAHVVVWDGKNEAGETVSSGVYIAVLRSGGATVSRRMMLLK